MKIAAIQFRPDKRDFSASADRLTALIEQACREGAGLVVCPEMALTGYLFPDPAAALQVAEPAGGRTYQRFAPLCRAHGAYLVLGYPEVDGDNLYNAALVIGPDGALVYNYRKRLLYELDETWARPGDRPYPLLAVPRLGTLTVGICMDLNDDRFIAFLHAARPDAVAFCTNWIHQGLDMRPYWRLRLAGAPCTFIAADTYGREQAGDLAAHFLGRSAVLDPQGRTLIMAEETGDAVLITGIRASCRRS
jgi:predicted amidohydrolase